MNMVKWQPLLGLAEMSDRLTRLFQHRDTRVSDGMDTVATAEWSPDVDIIEPDDEFVIKADLPEVTRKNVTVTVQDGDLTIWGERRQEGDTDAKRYRRIERAYGTFRRRFSLPDYVEEAKGKAEFKEGVLTVHLPKTEKIKPKAIEVKVA